MTDPTSDTTLAMPSPSAGRDDGPVVIPGYEIVGELGRGGMGVVFRATQPSLRRSVAIKMLLSGPLSGEAERLRFRTEAEAAGSLQHPNIVRVFEVGEADGRPFFSMDFVDGQSLAQRLDAGPLPPNDAAKLVGDVADAIQYAHGRGILHRDLKPHNILIGPAGQPMVTDFGLAKRVGEAGQTVTGVVLGTPSYMAPEQANGDKEISAAVDVYGLGAVLYECLTGRPPFLGSTPFDTIVQVLESDPAPPRLLNPSVPRDLETVCLKCLEKDPRRRYASAAELASDLRRFVAGESIHARSMNLAQRLTRALERGGNDVQFAGYGTLFYWLALVMLLPEVIVTLVTRNHWPVEFLPIAQLGRAAGFLGLVAWYRPGRLMPGDAAERQLWGVWGGYLLACFTIGLSHRLVQGWGTEVEPRLYQALCGATAMGFFAMGANFWGGCYAIGMVFLGLAFVMAIDLAWAPLQFGLLWAASLVAIGRRLQRLDAARSSG